jgi:predicted DNA-binding protein with PD1-like motif
VKTKLIHDGGEKTFANVFDKDDEVASGLLAFAKDNKLSASHFTAIGAFERVTLGFFERMWRRSLTAPTASWSRRV